MNSTDKILVKVGGASLQEEAVIAVIAEAIQEYRKYGHQVVLVHGGGPAINQELVRKGISWTFVDGQRVTTTEMMDTIEMVLNGLVNGKIVRALNTIGVPAVGLSGGDGQTLLCTQAAKELGLVGLIQKVKTNLIEGIMDIGKRTLDKPVPVVAPLGVSAEGQAFNINADWSASRLAQALSVKQLIFFTDQAGILDSKGQVIKELRQQSLQKLVDDRVVTGGMLTKVLTILDALRGGVDIVRVLNSKDALKGLWTDEVGTFCYREDYLKWPMELEEKYASV
jgi:acetylglutamate kinase